MFSKRFLPLVVSLGLVGLTGCAGQGEEASLELEQIVQGLAIDQVTPTRIVKGLDIPIAGEPEQLITDGRDVTSVALLGSG